jgi:Xaa-Pro aminopeptidase
MTQTPYRGSAPTEPFPAEEYRRRLERLDRALSRRGLDAFLVLTDVNRGYLSGFESSNGLLIVSRGRTPLLLTDFRYLEMARSRLEQTGVEVRDIGGRDEQVRALALAGEWKRVGFEGGISVREYRQMTQGLEGVEWQEAQGLVDDLRLLKSRAEQARIRRAVLAADWVLQQLLSRVEPGRSEWELRCELRQLADRVSQGESFDAIIAAGANSSMCHYHPGTRRLMPRDTLLVDMGVRVGGYVSDITRTVFLGEPDARMRQIHHTVLEAQQAAIAAIRPGVVASEIDRVARDVITAAGYGEAFGHGLGHSIGLEVHDGPGFHARNNRRLKPGMVITVEPGIYIPGLGGVRIEDVVVVRRGGCEVLTTSPKELLVL